MAKDPVAEWTWTKKTAPAKSEYKGKTYYFCAPAASANSTRPEKYVTETN